MKCQVGFNYLCNPMLALARDMIAGGELGEIRGYRGMTKGDCAALAQAVAAFSQLAAFDDIAEAEINPLIVKKENEGVVAVDGLIVRR